MFDTLFPVGLALGPLGLFLGQGLLGLIPLLVQFLVLTLERVDGFLGHLALLEGVVEELLQVFEACRSLGQLGRPLGVIIGRQRHEFRAALVDFRQLFRALCAELLGDVLTLVARLLFALLELFARVLELHLLLFQLSVALVQFAGALALHSFLIGQFHLFELELVCAFVGLAALGGEFALLSLEAVAQQCQLPLFLAELLLVCGEFRALLVQRRRGLGALPVILVECYPARVELRGLLPLFLALCHQGFRLPLQLLLLLVEFAPVFAEGLALLFDRGLQTLVFPALLIHAGAGFGQLSSFLLQLFDACGQLLSLFLEFPVTLVQRALLGGQRCLTLAPRCGAGLDGLPLLLQRREGGRMFGVTAIEPRARIVGCRQLMFEFAGTGFQLCATLCEFRLTAFEFLLLVGQLVLAIRELGPALVELLHAVSQILEQHFLLRVGSRLLLLPAPLLLVKLLALPRKCVGLLLQLGGLTRQVQIAAFDVRDVLLQLVRHLPQLFGQGPLNPLDPVMLRLQ